MKNPLQEQLLKAGLVKKAKLAEVLREQKRQRQGKGAAPGAAGVDAARLQAERAERDRALAAQQNARARAGELRAQVRQIVDDGQVQQTGDIPYRFADQGVLHSVLVDVPQRAQLAAGALVIARHRDGYALVPRTVAEKVRTRDPDCIVLDHGNAGAQVHDDGDFPVPDDLVW